MDNKQLILIGDVGQDLSGLAIACNKSVEEMRVVVVGVVNAMQVPMENIVRQLNQVFYPARELSWAIEEINQLMARLPGDVMESGKKVHSYDKFLPKPIGRQRRKNR